MTELKNPFTDIPGYECFGCAPDNPAGLKMRFFEEEHALVSHWEPEDHFQGYGRVLHGGIQATLMDELASWVVFVKLRTAGMTRDMRLTYHRPARTDGGLIVLRGRVESREEKQAVIRCDLYQGEIFVSEASCTYAVFPPHIATRRLQYPGIEAFYGDES